MIIFKTLARVSLLTYFISTSITPLHAACTPAGTAGDDVVSCTGTINAFQFLLGGNDTVTLTNVTARTYANSYWLDEALGGNAVTDGNDIFIANNSQFHWVLGFGGDDRFEILNSEFNNLYADTNPGHGTAQRGNDTILIENAISYGYILGGNDNDYIEIKDSNVSNVASGYSNIYTGILIQGGDGSDKVVIETPTNITATTLNGGDDRDSADTFVDQLSFKQWTGDLNGSQLLNWEQMVLDDNSKITFLDNNLSLGTNTGLDVVSGLPYGLSIQNNAELFIDHSFFTRWQCTQCCHHKHARWKCSGESTYHSPQLYFNQCFTLS